MKKDKKCLTVAPFKCVWHKELKFKDAGRGCITFEAFAHNDVTVVFREQAGSSYYHYRMDESPNYTVVFGSHRNKRLRIEVSGKTVVDVFGVGLCSSSSFQSYWIGVYDGLISIGKGSYPFQNVVFEWRDMQPNFKVKYVGLSSWDKHVGYRNICVLSSPKDFSCLGQRALNIGHLRGLDFGSGSNYSTEESDEEGVRDADIDVCLEQLSFEHFLENPDLSDVSFVVGCEEKVIPAHKAILALCGSFSDILVDNVGVIQVPRTTYSVLHAFLRYIYTGRTQVLETELESLRDLSKEFHIAPLVESCEEMIHCSETEGSGEELEIVYSGTQMDNFTNFVCELPINTTKLRHLLASGSYSDLAIFVDGFGYVARGHKVILSLWSEPFFKMFTNGLKETSSPTIFLQDVSPEAILAMLDFMYGAEVEWKESPDTFSLMLPLLFLADRFGIGYLHQECCKNILESLSEDLVCPVLHAVSFIPTCRLLQETCIKSFAKHFDYCTSTSTDFVMLDEAVFKRILEHPYMTATSEERVLDAVLLWCMNADKSHGWQAVDLLLESSLPESIFGEKLQSLVVLLPLVRFPLMPLVLLEALKNSNLSKTNVIFHQLVQEALSFSNGNDIGGSSDYCRFQHRSTSFKELQYLRDGDENGMIYYAGTSYGEHQWVNPCSTMKMHVTASSPASRYTDPRALVSRTFQGTSFAGPRLVNGRMCAWWKIDIGEGHQLMCNYYTIRQDGSTAFPRSWSLEGSIDDLNWMELSVHNNDHRIYKPGQFASWPVKGSNSLLPFRYFRVILTGPTASEATPWNFCICYLELYGYFR